MLLNLAQRLLLAVLVSDKVCEAAFVVQLMGQEGRRVYCR